MAVLIEMQFVMLSLLGPGNVLHGVQMSPQEGALLGVSGWFKSIVKHRILWVGKRVSCPKKRVQRTRFFAQLTLLPVQKNFIQRT